MSRKIRNILMPFVLIIMVGSCHSVLALIADHFEAQDNTAIDVSLIRKFYYTPKFSPFNPKLEGSALIRFELIRPADILIYVEDKKGNLIYEVANEDLSPQGHKEYCFQSYNFNNEIIPDGKYILCIVLDNHINPASKLKGELIVDHAPQDLYIMVPTTEVISATRNYTFSWTSASPYGAAWNHLKKYQVLGRKLGQMGSFDVLKDKIHPEVTSTTLDLQADGVWEIKVRTIDEEDNWCDSDGTSSAGYAGDDKRLLRVKVDTVPPAPFNVSHPSDGEMIDSHDVLIKWGYAQDDNLDCYEVIVKTNIERYTAPSVYHQEIPAAASREVLLKNLDKGEYYIYITAFDRMGNYRKNDGETGVAKTHMEKYQISKEAYSMFEIKNKIPSPYDGLVIPPDSALKTFSPEDLAKIQIDNLKNIAANSKTLDDGYGKIVGDLYSGKKQIYEFNEIAKGKLLKIALDKEADWKLRVYADGWVSPDDPPESFDVKVRIYKDKNERIELRRCVFGSIASTKRPEKQKEAIDILIGALKENDDGIASTAANELGRLKNEKAIDPLIDAVKESRKVYKRLLQSGWKEYENHNTDAGARLHTAMRAIGELKARKAMPLLIEIMEDLDFDHEVDADSINGFAAMALGEIGDERVLPAMNKALKGKKYKQRLNTYDAIANAKSRIEKRKR